MVHVEEDGTALRCVDRHLIHEVIDLALQSLTTRDGAKAGVRGAVQASVPWNFRIQAG